MPEFNILDHGAVGDGKTNDALAIQRAIDACTTAGGGRVLVPAGKTYLSGTIELKSNVELYIERGAIIQGSGNYADYTHTLAVGALSGGTVNQDAPRQSMLLTARHAVNIAICGGGVIDGGGRFFIKEPGQYIHVMQRERPFTLFLIGVKNLTLRDVVIRDGALWTVRLSGCEDVVIHAIRIDNDLKLPNNDGIDLDRCRNVRISDCHIVCGDDCICLKACQETDGMGACENIVVSNCTLMSTSSALIIGAECREPMRNVIFEGCVIQSSNRGLAIHLSEQSDIENVLFSNMIVETRIFHDRWWGHGEPIYITALPWTKDHQVGHVRHIRFMNILCRSENGIFIQGWEKASVEDILLENVRVELDKWSSWPAGKQDLRPCPGEEMPLHPYPGMYLKNASGVVLRNVEVVWGSHINENYSHALESHQVDGLMIENFRGQPADPQNYLEIFHE